MTTSYVVQSVLVSPSVGCIFFVVVVLSYHDDMDWFWLYHWIDTRIPHTIRCYIFQFIFACNWENGITVRLPQIHHVMQSNEVDSLNEAAELLMIHLYVRPPYNIPIKTKRWRFHFHLEIFILAIALSVFMAFPSLMGQHYEALRFQMFMVNREFHFIQSTQSTNIHETDFTCFQLNVLPMWQMIVFVFCLFLFAAECWHFVLSNAKMINICDEFIYSVTWSFIPTK